MKPARLPILGLLAVAGLAACGHKGALLPPLVNVPSPPSDLKLLQRGDKLILGWKNPATFIDGRALESVAAVEIWLAEDALEAGQPLPKLPTAEEFADKAKLEARVLRAQFATAPTSRPSGKQETSGEKGQTKKGARGGAAKTEKPVEAAVQTYEYTLKTENLTSKRFVFGLKAELNKSKVSDLSSLAAIVPRALAVPPAGLQAAAGRESVDLRWEAPLGNIDGSRPAALKGYNIYRSEGEGRSVRLNSTPVKEPSFADKTFVFGTEYSYTVRAAADEAEPFGESGDAVPAVVRPMDTYPPQAPTGLTVLSGPDFISLSWDAGTDKDLAGYRVWRRVAGQTEFRELTTAAVTESTYQDKSTEKGVRYEYVVTAEDTAGNKSSDSSPVSGQLRGERS